MKAKNIKGLLLTGLLALVALSGCENTNNNNSESNSNPEVSESESSSTSSESNQDSESNNNSETSSESESESENKKPTLSDAINNTQTYSFVSATSGKQYEVVQEDFYYSSLTYDGYIVLDDDPGYFHSFDVVYEETDDGDYYETLKVFGRYAETSQYEVVTMYSFVSILNQVQSYFKPYDDNKDTYYSTAADMTYLFEQFFQSKIVGTCNLFEIDIKDGRLSEFRAIERYDGTDYNETAVIANFLPANRNNVAAYAKWVELGSNYTTRIVDVKQLVPSKHNSRIPVSMYENEEITINAIVSAFDLTTGFYITENNDSYGPVGLRVISNDISSTLSIGDRISVTGTVATESYNTIYTYLENATYEIIEEREDFPPIYDEDYLVDTYGGGTYAGIMFSRDLLFGGSIYSTFAYVYERPESLKDEEDTKITFICPNIADLQGNLFYFELVLSSKLDKNFRENIFNTIKDAGIYSSESGVSSAKELSLENLLVDYTFDLNLSNIENRGNYPISLQVLENSSITFKKSVTEKIESLFGLGAFPLASTYITSYKFGGTSELYIESVYGDFENTSKTGLFVTFEGVSLTGFNNYQTTLVNYGLTKLDEVKDYSSSRHSLFTKDNVVVDLSYDAERYTIQCWIYKTPLIRMPTIEEKLKAAIGSWFDVDNDFARLAGTYDADYSIFTIRNYAGVDYTDNPLTVVTLDLNTNPQTSYLTQFVRELGYKQYRDSNNKVMSYKIRGVLHQGIFKADKNVFIDVAVYPTSDYTYTGHSAYQYRMEMVFINGNAPLEIPTYTSLEPLALKQKAIHANAYYNPTLPSDSVVELWSKLPLEYQNVSYGFGSRDEAYVYTSKVDEAFEAVKESLLEAGYEQWGNTSNVYVMNITSTSSVHVCLIKESTKGYLRVINDMGGVDFWKQ